MGRSREVVCCLRSGSRPVYSLTTARIQLTAEEDLALRLPGSSVSIRPVFTYVGGQGKPPYVTVRPTGIEVRLPDGFVSVFPINTTDITLAAGETLEVRITLTTE